MEIVDFVLLFALGVFVGAGLAWIKFKKAAQRSLLACATLQQECGNERIKSSLAAAIAEERKVALDNLAKELEGLRSENIRIEKEISSVSTEKSALEVKLTESSKEADERRLKSNLEFSKLANEILDVKTKKFDEHSKKALDGLIEPLKGNIKTFQETILKKYEENLSDRSALKVGISSIIDAGKELRESSDSLAQALKGDSKAQGIWGEMVLEKVLESSGLRKGQEFTAQDSYTGDEGGRLLPDVTLHLSNQKCIFIDAKVSLTHYDAYVKAGDEPERLEAESALEDSFCERIKELSQKGYPDVQNVTTLDFVIMFTPIESALAVAVRIYDNNHQESLFEYAWKKGVIIASPLTLMPILKTIDLCWKAEYQNKNALSIADEAGKLYDKFAIFITKLQKVGESIERSHDLFKEAKNALSDGRGSLVRRTDKIRLLLKKEKKVPDEYFDGIEDIDADTTLEISSSLQTANKDQPQQINLT